MKTKPKFIAISEQIIKKITSGELLPGDQIPSENDLIKTFNISNTTARKVLLEIESKGLAKRIKGKGTFVLNQTPEHRLVRTIGSIDATRRGFHDYLVAEGFTHRDVILEKTILRDGISSDINYKHYIIEGPVVKIHLLRYADEDLMKDETKYISLTLCPRINRLSTNISYFKAYEELYDLKVSDMKQTFGVDIFTKQMEINNFDNEHPIPVYVLDSVILSNKDQVIEIEKSFYRGDKYKFSVIASPIYYDKGRKDKKPGKK